MRKIHFEEDVNGIHRFSYVSNGKNYVFTISKDDYMFFLKYVPFDKNSIGGHQAIRTMLFFNSLTKSNKIFT